MDFELEDEMLALQQTAHRFANEEIIPIAAEHDASGEFPRAVIEKAWELGLSSTCIPESCGGLGLSIEGCCVITEEVARGCAGIASA